MNARPKGRTPIPMSSPPLRSGGEPGEGSSGHYGQRSQCSINTKRNEPNPQLRPLVATMLADRVLAEEHLDVAVQRLREQRAFRIEQLTRLLAREIDQDPARAEIEMGLLTAARAALVDIDGALRRIEQGTYGTCRRCGDAMSIERLNALPMAPMCGQCQLTHELSPSDPAHLVASRPVGRGRATHHGGTSTRLAPHAPASKRSWASGIRRSLRRGERRT